MAQPKNQAAWLLKADTLFQVDDAPMPTAGPGEIVVKNGAIAVNPLDCHMQDIGVFIQQWPAIFGCEVAGEVYEVGPNVNNFKKGDRLIGHTINLVSGRPQDGGFALYTVIPAEKAAILPDAISFTDGVVIPFAFQAAVCALSLKIPGVALPGVATPTLGLPYPSLQEPQPSAGKTLVVNGGSSSVGSMTTQLGRAAGIHVISITSAQSHDFSKVCGAAEAFDYNDSAVIEKVIVAVEKSGHQFVGIFDAISTPDTYHRDLEILTTLNGGHLACTHPPPADVPTNVEAGMIFGINDVATPVWRDYVTPALQAGKLQCLPPPLIVGKGLEYVQEALKRSKAGVSAKKVVVEL